MSEQKLKRKSFKKIKKKMSENVIVFALYREL